MVPIEGVMYAFSTNCKRSPGKSSGHHSYDIHLSAHTCWRVSSLELGSTHTVLNCSLYFLIMLLFLHIIWKVVCILLLHTLCLKPHFTHSVVRQGSYGPCISYDRKTLSVAKRTLRKLTLRNHAFIRSLFLYGHTCS